MWGYSGLIETLETLDKAEIKVAGAGRNIEEATRPAVIKVGRQRRVIIFSFGTLTSGIPSNWAASKDGAGVNLMQDLSVRTVRRIKEKVESVKREGDIVIASIHWGGNWGFEIPREQTAFAHHLIDRAAVDIIHGHSSHHIKAIEVYQGKPILYGCGDFINDYEGIGGYTRFRGDLSLMYFVSVDPGTGTLSRFHMIPMKMKRFRVSYATNADMEWAMDTLNREGEKFSTQVELNKDNTFILKW